MEYLKTQVEKYVNDNIASFHENRLNKLRNLKLSDLLKKKNPYLYKAMDLNTPEKIVRILAQAFISSTEETMFGNWLEGLAIFVAKCSYNGRKSNAEGIDLELEKEEIHYIVSIKSGPNWSNSSSMKKQKQNFLKAIKIYRTSGNKKPCVAIEGCCYGNNNTSKDTHEKLCGQAFWEFISGDPNMYLEIIEPLGINAKTKNEDYQKEFDKMITKFTKEFSYNYCDNHGNINWNKIVQLNSSRK